MAVPVCGKPLAALRHDLSQGRIRTRKSSLAFETPRRHSSASGVRANSRGENNLMFGVSQLRGGGAGSAREGSWNRTKDSSTVRRAAAGGRTAVAAGRIDSPRMTMDKDVLLPGESRHRGPAPGCRPQILSHSAFRFSAADCAWSLAGASNEVSAEVPGCGSSGPSLQISQRPFKASGNRNRRMASLQIIGKTVTSFRWRAARCPA